MEKLHPAMHVSQGQGGVAVGVLTSQGWVTVKAKNTKIGPSDDRLMFKPLQYREVTDRWTVEDFDSYLKNPQAPTWAEAYKRVFDLVDYWTVLKDEREKHLVTAWTLGTYVHQCFSTYPRLSLQGNMHTGKSKVLRTISLIAFNGLWQINPTMSTIFRLIDALRPTLCLDEIESLSGTDHKEINSILNQGYLRGAHLLRSEKLADGSFEPRAYGVYAPIAFGGIRGLNRVLADRTITITTVLSTDLEAINRDFPSDNADFAKARAACYAVLLLRSQDALNSTVELPGWLNGRNRQLYKPLLIIARLAGDEAAKAIQEYAAADVETRDMLSEGGVALLGVLRLLTYDEDLISVYPGDLSNMMGKDRYDNPRYSANEVGTLLRAFGWKVGKRTAKGFPYRITRAEVEVVERQHGITHEGNQ
jgi:hypothetical protein